ncbi:MAG: sterol desaturase family protein, partial [Hyphococcus sp.]
YGIVKNLGTFNPLVISFHEWIGMARDVLRAKSFKDAIGYLFGPPGWSPDGSRMTSAMIKERWRRLPRQDGGVPSGAATDGATDGAQAAGAQPAEQAKTFP